MRVQCFLIILKFLVINPGLLLLKAGEKMLKDLEIRILMRDMEQRPGVNDEEFKNSWEALEALKKIIGGSFEKGYQDWYTESCALLKQSSAPERLDEFQALYLTDPKRKSLNAGTYSIKEWLTELGVVSNFMDLSSFDELSVVRAKFQLQNQILASLNRRFESSLFDIRKLVQADFFDSEVDAARHLLKSGFLRSAGAIGGVVLEKHLGQVATDHSVSIRKKHPTIADLNDPLKEANVYDVPTWRFIQRLADIRNLCDHSKDREPTNDKVREMIDGVEKITKTVF